MIKDPNHTQETPYELLGLLEEAPLADVRQALPRFMRDRRKLARLGLAQEAARKLQSAAARARIDIWFYLLEVPESDRTEVAPTPLVLDEFRFAPVATPAALYCDLEGTDLTTETRDITVLAMRIGDVQTLDGLKQIRLRPAFDC
ncbi:MAG: hypothetical protein FJY75_10320 [Candidatus Eisenbacteria bacterium]|uniref:Uncharacterized protein n=1 Tax=Eiseniibacteriota bacterium TaxID=2212470 RepID=A0A937X9Z2_UNCEI|nr:hypothetical protein [Candidatus Eisenbacteria bacterium]